VLDILEALNERKNAKMFSNVTFSKEPYNVKINIIDWINQLFWCLKISTMWRTVSVRKIHLVSFAFTWLVIVSLLHNSQRFWNHILNVCLENGLSKNVRPPWPKGREDPDIALRFSEDILQTYS
jgi:hypothetical protein